LDRGIFQVTHLSNLESHPVTHPQVTTCWRSETHRNVLFSGGFTSTRNGDFPEKIAIEVGKLGI